MRVGPGIESGNLRWRWIAVAAIGALCVIWFVSPVAVLFAAAVIGGVGLLLFHLLPLRAIGARSASVCVVADTRGSRLRRALGQPDVTLRHRAALLTTPARRPGRVSAVRLAEITCVAPLVADEFFWGIRMPVGTFPTR